MYIKPLFGFAVVVASLCTHAAHAQATRTWISGVGDDANPCSRTAPCKTWVGAISKTAAGGEIDALDPGGFGSIAVSKSIILDGRATHASILATGTNGVSISAGNNDVVVLRGLSLVNGTSGVRVVNAKAIYIEDCVISGFTVAGLSIVPSSANPINVYVRNSVFRNNAKNIDATTNTANAPVKITVVNSSLFGSPVGIDVAQQTVVSLQNTSIAGHTTVGIRTAGNAVVSIDGGLIAHNAVGIDSSARVRISDVMVSHNTTCISGTVDSFGNNRLAAGNDSDGIPTSTLPQQ